MCTLATGKHVTLDILERNQNPRFLTNIWKNSLMLDECNMRPSNRFS